MQLPGLITVQPEQTDVIEQVAHMMGKSFMEELWTEVWLESLDQLGADEDRKLEISRAIMKYDFTLGAPYQCCYMLPDMAAATGAYLSSDLKGQIWSDIEDKATTLMTEAILTDDEKAAMMKRANEMEAISDFSWMIDHAQGSDFIHFFSIGVNSEMRGSGA
ncbi:MAG: GNAT family N-acetyltransferase, partial [Raoultibacter sp.]